MHKDQLREALQKIADLVDSEADEPLDEAIALARAALSTKPPETAEAVAWCQPMDNGKHQPRRFMVFFEDAERGYSIFDNEAEARAFFEKANVAWNCWLLGALPLDASPPNPWRPDREAVAQLVRTHVFAIRKDHIYKLADAILSLLPAQPSEGVIEELHLANLALARSNARLFEEAQTAARLLAEARAALSKPAQPSEGMREALVERLLEGKIHSLSAATDFHWTPDARKIVKEMLLEAVAALSPSLPDHGFSHGIRKDNQ